VIYYFYEKYIMNSKGFCCCCQPKTKIDEDKNSDLRLDELNSEIDEKVSKDEIMLKELRR
jgi:hypothetical protein